MTYHQGQKMSLWLRGEGVPPSSIKDGNRTSTVQEETLNVFQPGVTSGIEFFVLLYKSALGYSAINTACSALSSFLVLEDGVKMVMVRTPIHLVVCCMKGIFELKPSLYPNILRFGTLGCLKTVDTLSSLTLKELTLNLTMLLCLTTGQRGQTIHKFDVNYIQEMDDRYRIELYARN